jgi:hypothetical protein
MAGKEAWAFVFLLGVLAFNWPFLSVFGSGLVYALFGMWAFLILCVGIMNSLDSGQDNS